MKGIKSLLITAACLATLASATTSQAFFLNFENGTEGANVADIAGVSFTDYNGYHAKYDDIRTGNWNFTSDDLNISAGTGYYHMFGNIAVSAGINADARGLIVDFSNNDGTTFTTGYAMYSLNGSPFSLDAYLTDGSSVTVTGGATITDNGSGGITANPMSFLTVNATSGNFIDYVVLHDTGNFWIVDNMSGDTSGVSAVPEPSTILLLGGGLAGLAFWRRKQQVK